MPPDGWNVQAVDPPEFVNPTVPIGTPEPFTKFTIEVNSASLFPA